VKKYIEQTVFGSGQIDLHCIDESGCKAKFAQDQLERALDKKTASVLFEKLQYLEIRKAGIENLHQCPWCDYRAIIEDEDNKIFECKNPLCLKESCRLCNEESHIPLRCEEVESKNQTSLRTKVEEKMSDTLIRKCPKCGAKFYKTEGCNKLTCECGTCICYICRKKITGYDHFCPHTRGPTTFGTCPKCNKCYLFLANTAAEDAKIVEATRQKELTEATVAPNPMIGVGPIEDKKAKKRKNHGPYPIPAPQVPNVHNQNNENHRRRRKRRRHH